MLSWVSESIQKSQQQKTPHWYENEIRFGPWDQRRPAATTTATTRDGSYNSKKASQTLRRRNNNTSDSTTTATNTNLGNRFIPKLRWAFEAATHMNSTGINNHGSFPVVDDHNTNSPPPTPSGIVSEETAFEACDSFSCHSGQSSSVSCGLSANLSYNMSRIDEDDARSTNTGTTGGGTPLSLNPTTTIFVDSLVSPLATTLPSPCNSDADSFFGRSIRDVATGTTTAIDTEIEDRDDVWLLSPSTNNDNINNSNNTHRPLSFLHKNKPRLVQLQTNLAVTSWGDDDNEEEEETTAEDEEEIRFDNEEDCFFLHRSIKDNHDDENEISNIDQPSSPSPTTRLLSSSHQETTWDENRNTGNIMSRFSFGRKRAHMLGKNLKDMVWNSSHHQSSSVNGSTTSNDSRRRKGKKCKNKAALPPKSTNQQHRRKTKRQAPILSSLSRVARLHSDDPLKELSKCHERMAAARPFSPIKSKHHRWSRRGFGSPLHGDDDDTNYRLQRLESTDPDVESSPSLAASSSALHELPKDSSSGSSCDCPESNLNSHSSSQGEGVDSSDTMQDNSNENENDDLGINTSNTKEETKKFKIKFRSPRNDTPRIVMGDRNRMQATEEPRVLYTSEGTVEAIVHPMDPEPPQYHFETSSYRNFLPNQDSRGCINYFFHSELSTLYEVSSSLESASFGTYSGSAESEEASANCARSSGNRSLLPSLSSSTSSDSISKQNSVPGRKDSSSMKSKSCLSPRSRGEGTADTRSSSSISGGMSSDPYCLSDHEIKMRWAYSLGTGGRSAGQWRQPIMGLMNTEELSNSYVAEI